MKSFEKISIQRLTVRPWIKCGGGTYARNNAAQNKRGQVNSQERMKLKHAQQKFILEPISNACDILGLNAGVQIHSRHFTNLCIRSQASED
jgi:hypothetical protein